MEGRSAKDALFDALASVAKALGHGHRAEIIDVLGQGERPVDQTASEIGQSVANTSQHLQVLLRAGLVTTRREGTRVYYAHASARVADLWAAVRDVAAAHVAELDELAAAYLGDRSQLETVSREELQQRMQDRSVVVIDVRPEDEFRAGHITGALSIDIDDLMHRVPELRPDKPVVAYCRGPFCVYADNAVRVLRERGIDAARLQDGYPEWARAGLPVTSVDRPDADADIPGRGRVREMGVGLAGS